MKGGARPLSFPCLILPYSKKVRFYCWVDRQSFIVVRWRISGAISRPSGDFLHHNRKKKKKKKQARRNEKKEGLANRNCYTKRANLYVATFCTITKKERMKRKKNGRTSELKVLRKRGRSYMLQLKNAKNVLALPDEGNHFMSRSFLSDFLS